MYLFKFRLVHKKNTQGLIMKRNKIFQIKIYNKK